jgi:hypothetical protein
VIFRTHGFGGPDQHGDTIGEPKKMSVMSDLLKSVKKMSNDVKSNKGPDPDGKKNAKTGSTR